MFIIFILIIILVLIFFIFGLFIRFGGGALGALLGAGTEDRGEAGNRVQIACFFVGHSDNRRLTSNSPQEDFRNVRTWARGIFPT